MATREHIPVEDFFRPPSTWPVAVTPDGNGSWVGSNRQPDRTTLVRSAIATGDDTDAEHLGIEQKVRTA